MAISELGQQTARRFQEFKDRIATEKAKIPEGERDITPDDIGGWAILPSLPSIEISPFPFSPISPLSPSLAVLKDVYDTALSKNPNVRPDDIIPKDIGEFKPNPDVLDLHAQLSRKMLEIGSMYPGFTRENPFEVNCSNREYNIVANREYDGHVVGIHLVRSKIIAGYYGKTKKPMDEFYVNSLGEMEGYRLFDPESNSHEKKLIGEHSLLKPEFDSASYLALARFQLASKVLMDAPIEIFQ